MDALSRKYAWRWAAAITGYYCWFQAFYNAVSFGTVLPYADLEGALLGILYNFPTIAAIFVANLFIVFRLVRIRGREVKIAVDALCSLGALAVINFINLAIMGQFVWDDP